MSEKSTLKKKRFIAGAVCPECKKMDTMQLYLENNVEKVTCVACGHSMVQPDDTVSAATRQFEQVIGVFKPE
ncbi:YheV family putative zinc ribbon protein [Flocculibacter collagenilyticus]|uniref:YheV family putative zinc ribbon protein n=1 Tax=Flocculibacter collagenilyticus TaxID=2744479 RepID=UPI0018F44A77|nr:YheV family putative zinc ribbon protein [Flocculibacter collagenilyticus]